MCRMLVVILIAANNALICSGQQNPPKSLDARTELDVRKLESISVRPVTGVDIKVNGDTTTIVWKVIPLERIVRYEIYRRIVSSNKWTKIGESRKPPFTDHQPCSGTLSYSV